MILLHLLETRWVAKMFQHVVVLVSITIPILTLTLLNKVMKHRICKFTFDPTRNAMLVDILCGHFALMQPNSLVMVAFQIIISEDLEETSMSILE